MPHSAHDQPGNCEQTTPISLTSLSPSLKWTQQCLLHTASGKTGSWCLQSLVIVLADLAFHMPQAVRVCHRVGVQRKGPFLKKSGYSPLQSMPRAEDFSEMPGQGENRGRNKLPTFHPMEPDLGDRASPLRQELPGRLPSPARGRGFQALSSQDSKQPTGRAWRGQAPGTLRAPPLGTGTFSLPLGPGFCLQAS